MAHIFFIDPISKLNIKKDSSLMMALSLQNLGEEVFLLFEDDFYVSNSINQDLDLHSFSGYYKEDGFYIAEFKVLKGESRRIEATDTVHMRIDPPYDQRYQRYLWMLDYLQETVNCKVLNNPLGIMKYNEKLCAFSLENRVESYVGSSIRGAKKFAIEQKNKGIEALILKPLDLYSGIGVEKVNFDLLEEKFVKKCKEFGGAIIVQPFLKEVLNGEFRSLYFDAKELGTIIKLPQEGEFLTNIAQGAKFEKRELPSHLKKECDEMSAKLLSDGVRFIAFDLLGDCITEVNVTCPGLVVEVSFAHDKNFADSIAALILNN